METLLVVDGDPTIFVHDLSYMPHMILRGRLSYRAGSRCLGVEVDRGAGRRVTATPIWPLGVRPLVADGRRGVSVPGFGSVLDGDEVIASGDVWDADDKRRQRLRELADACVLEGGFVVFNRDSFVPAPDAL